MAVLGSQSGPILFSSSSVDGEDSDTGSCRPRATQASVGTEASAGRWRHGLFHVLSKVSCEVCVEVLMLMLFNYPMVWVASVLSVEVVVGLDPS